MSIQLDEIRLSLPLKSSTDPKWAIIATNNLDVFLCDHASCERKAHAAAMMLVTKFPEHHELQDRMIGLAKEELEHFHQVLKIMRERGLTSGPDEVDSYVKGLLTKVRHPRDQHLLDRLLIAAMIEARSCERFCLFADALPAGDLQDFYRNFAREESAHFPLFVNTAKLYYPSTQVDQTLDDMLVLEAHVLAETPLRATVH